MSAFAIPLLEGTDPILTGAYKKREDPVNDCATISQHRGYSGMVLEFIYSIYYMILMIKIPKHTTQLKFKFDSIDLEISKSV